MIDNYFRFNKTKKTRFDLEFCLEKKSDLYTLNKSGDCVIYLGKNPHIKANKERKSDLTISNGLSHLSSLYFPEPEYPFFAYGDLIKTNDALLFILTENKIEILVFKDKKNIISSVLFNMLIDGEFKNELDELRKLTFNDFALTV